MSGKNILLCLVLGYGLMTPPLANAEIPVFAGADVRALNEPEGVSLAGFGGGPRRYWKLKRQNPYAHWLVASLGKHAELRVKTLYLEFEGRKLVIVSTDMIAADDRLEKYAATWLTDLRIGESDILLTATHTHSGPGGFAKNKLWELLAADKYVKKIFERIGRSIADSIRAAHAARVPAHLGTGDFILSGVTRNRRYNHHQPVKVTFLKAQDLSGKSIGTMVSFPIHGTVFGMRNRILTADIPGAVERALEKKTGTPVAFVNGAEGDVSPLGFDADFDKLDRASEPVADILFTEWQRISMGPVHKFNRSILTADLPWPRMNLKACAKKKFLPPIFLPFNLPRHVPVDGFTVNDRIFVALPGEPTTAIEEDIQRRAHALGAEKVSVLGLANGHVSYIVTPEEYKAGGYEACSSMFGKNIGPTFSKTAEMVVRVLSTPR